ncbi:YeiH family protein [Poseidonibacter lekithochrous]|uniref:YeiH family protein n=1 Tax=Poseidonibacter lekithochrous TaxID=1904463 RepID=UPI0008FC8277|nr:YeiH family protein [Poseidonibacter lekithochrous]QKJ22942.1 YeiH/YadS family membrane protein [Poseidonibacter lekithochrous]
MIGFIFVLLLAIFSTILSEFFFFKDLGISAMIIGILLGMLYANTIKQYFPTYLQSGIIFCTKTILRIGIVLYGFRLTFQNLQDVGIYGVLVAFLMLASTFLIGYIFGIKVLKLDREITILTSAGSAICGAAAVLASESVLKCEAYKSAIAVSSVVVFGTIAMFLYPFLYKLGLIDLSVQNMGIYIGATLHEVAHVVGSSNVLGEEASSNAVIVKMIRVMMLAPFLILLSIWILKTSISKTNSEKSKITIPWFAVFFIFVVAFNSFDLLASEIVVSINYLDNFALTMAMTALGMETSFSKFKNVGLKPIYLSLVLFTWLIFGGYFIVQFLFV